ncbi:hypothetical protein FRC10_001719 [Ceratobasidium sp. 414]|nr:hypothetical protein FRC10_001719 [Ceratobasidium sp. 414]
MSAKSSSHSENQPNWGIPIDTYLKKLPVHGVPKHPVDQVVSAIQTLIAGEPNTLDDITLESILSVVYYPEHLALLNTEITSTWFALMEPYIENHSLFEQSFGLLMTQVYGLVMMVGFLYHNQMLDRFINRLAGAGADLHDAGVLPFLNLCTSGMANPYIGESGRTFAHHIKCFTKIHGPDEDLDSSDALFLASTGGFDLTAALFFLKNIFDARDQLLEVFDRVPAFGLFPILCMIRLQLWFCLEAGGGEQDVLKMLKVLQDINHRYYLVSGRDLHRLVSSLIAAVFDDISGQNLIYEDYVDPVGPADVAMISSTLIRQISPPSVGTEPAQLPSLWDMFDWAQKIILETGEIRWYPALLTPLLNRIWIEIFAGITSSKSGLRNNIMSFSGNLLMHLA